MERNSEVLRRASAPARAAINAMNAIKALSVAAQEPADSATPPGPEQSSTEAKWGLTETGDAAWSSWLDAS